ncbi:MAG: methylenetetrahydrofolate--tRNA-(uracil(54)-C(5))-methyltransferase (FADH(2)-oxidizing) TrmFO [Bacilli bacterium]|jgi:methylenetetrahydrofolate--tRNA-(uracil-5-)-methyltransferase|nr:methylenetetrahydrofolate--tRNA-(uracil(54)-C(5))-methyltransferase (FADH(2)-oxidizing) TrmFO [Bacilli bacterium]
MDPVKIIGAGLAGCEAAYQLAKRNIKVQLYEMRPHKMTPAHQSAYFGELVCSNSFRGDQLINAVGILKQELLLLDSIVMKTAYEHQVPAGAALAVDREGFAQALTNKIKNLDNVEVINEEAQAIFEGRCIIASGPLSSEALSNDILKKTNTDSLYFYDAIAPIIEKASIDFNKAYYKSRYDKEEASYINCAMNELEYNNWYDALIKAQCAPLKEFEKLIVFEGCMPIEEIARRGYQTMLYGPLKPVGLEKDEHDHPVAVVQLRQDDAQAHLYNMVGFQTHLLYAEQKRLIQMIPGLENANIVRYGVMHRNTFINAPKLLKPTFQSKFNDDLFFAGQISGVEGYVESIASGLMAGINMARYYQQEELLIFPEESICGAMAHYITNANPQHFQPMNANFGIVKKLEGKVKKQDKKLIIAQRALAKMKEFIDQNGIIIK